MYLTDGCVDVGRAPDLYLNEKAVEIASVRMTGNYGGEVLREVRQLSRMNYPLVCSVKKFSQELSVHRRTNQVMFRAIRSPLRRSARSHGASTASST